MKSKTKDRILAFFEAAPFLIGIAFGILSHWLWDKTPAESILTGIVLGLSCEAIWRLLILPKTIRQLWETKTRDIWGEPIGSDFANSDRVAIQHETLIKKFIEEFKGAKPASRGCIGHIFLQSGVDLPMYGNWIMELIQADLIAEYETVNLITPKEALKDPVTKKVLKSLRDFDCQKKTRIHVLSESMLRNRCKKWKKTTGNKNVEGFIEYINKEYNDFDKIYKGKQNNCFETYHVFDENLIKKKKHFGEYVVINRRIVLKYDESTELLECLIGDEPVKLYSQVFDASDLGDIPPDVNGELKIEQFSPYLKKIGIA